LSTRRGSLQFEAVKSLFEHSAELEIPIFAAKIAPSRTEKNPYSKVLSNDNIDPYWKAYQIYLEEINVLPKLRTFQDVFRLRDDHRIHEFREALHNWSVEIKNGDPETEMSMRKEIRKANEELKKLGEWQKIGKWATYISIPVSIASVLTGCPLGLSILPISIGIRIHSDVNEWRHRWLLFGR
jgi:hypothetical protein